jgi:hypothetical protein
MDAGFAEEEFQSLFRAFPGIQRLHIVTLPSGLVPLCGPGIQAPADLRLTLTQDSSRWQRHCNFFVASHLFTLPFSWAVEENYPSAFFKKVVRLQISELNEDLGGLSLEKFIESIKALPHLRRLGTISSRAAVLFDLSRDDCKLEELVFTTELEDVKDFFATFMLLEQRKKRGSLRRLAAHILAGDGAARMKLEIENAICAGWYNIAANLMRTDGWITFSTGAKALQETAIGQLPWYLPQHFSLDTVSYGESSIPCSTPMSRPLPFYGNDGRQQPSGTLVSGTMRRSAQQETQNDWHSESSIQSLPASPTGSRGNVLFGNSSGQSSSRSGPRNSMSSSGKLRRSVSLAKVCRFLQVPDSTPPPQEWMSMYLADAVEALMEAAERQRQEFMGTIPGTVPYS